MTGFFLAYKQRAHSIIIANNPILNTYTQTFRDIE